MKDTETKDPWPVIEAAARKQENVGDDYSLRRANIDFEDDQPEYVEYRLRKMSGENEGDERNGRIENYAAIRPQGS